MAASGDYVCSLTPELQEKALKELNEKAEWRQRDIQALREMVVAHKGLKCPTDDAYLLRFLRGKKFDYDRAYQQVISYYTIRAQNAEILRDLRPSTITTCMDAGVSQVLPKRAKDGCRIIYFRPGKWNPESFNLYDILKMNLINMELVIRDEATQVNGVYMLANTADVGWLQAKNLERNYFKITTSLLQNSFPCRFKGFHVFNEPAVFSYIFSIVKPFLSEKTRSRMNFYGTDLASLNKTFEKEILPSELGGDLEDGDTLAKAWKKEVLSHEDYLGSLQQYSIELDRQIASTKSADNMDCVVGTYKKLSID